MARTVDTDKKHVAETLRAAAAHQGTAFVEIYQNCNVFNDGAFDAVRAKGQKERNQIRLEHGQPIRFGAEGERGVVRGAGGRLELVDVADVGEDALLVHDAQRAEPSLAFELAHLAARPTGPTPIGDLPRRRASGLRGRAVGRAGGGPRGGGHRRARGAAALRGHLDGFVAARTPNGSNEAAAGTAVADESLHGHVRRFGGGLDLRAKSVETGPTSCPGSGGPFAALAVQDGPCRWAELYSRSGGQSATTSETPAPA